MSADLSRFAIPMFKNPRAASTLEMLQLNFEDTLQWEEDSDGIVYFNVEEDGAMQTGFIPVNDSRVTWL